jgi:hypothetical protein
MNLTRRFFFTALIMGALSLAAPPAKAQEPPHGAQTAAGTQSPAWHDYPWSIGGGTEANQGSKEGWAQGYLVILDRSLFDRRFIIGLRGFMDSDYRTVSNFGGTLCLRLYPFMIGPSGAFAQIGFGLGSWQEDERRRFTGIVDWAAGFRYFFLGGFYAEAYIRSGFPSQWALGLMAGHSFTF